MRLFSSMKNLCAFVSTKKNVHFLVFFFHANLSFNATRHHLGVRFINDLTIMEWIYHFPLLLWSQFCWTFSQLNPLKFPRWLKKMWTLHRSYKQNFPHFRPFSLARENVWGETGKLWVFSRKCGMFKSSTYENQC